MVAVAFYALSVNNLLISLKNLTRVGFAEPSAAYANTNPKLLN